ncbi:MAG: LytR/AlgR family response regulator transcription factor [Prolixibacteraceae bacterium]
MIQSLIVDDDSSSRNILKKFLEIGEKVTVVASVSSAAEALIAVEQFKPNVIFLDINMPEEDGLQFARRLISLGLDIQIVFTSAYRNYAATAYSLKPLDFIVKPFGLDEVFDVITKIENYFEVKSRQQKILNGISIPEKLRFKTLTGYVFLMPHEVLFIKVTSDRTELFLVNGATMRILSILKNLDQELQEYYFLKINRSVIINLKYVERVEKKSNICVIKANNLEYSFTLGGKVYGYIEQLNSLKLG